MEGKCCACRAEHFAHVGVLHEAAMRSVKELMPLCVFVDGVCTFVALRWAAVWHDSCDSAMCSYAADILCIARMPVMQPARGGARTLLCVLNHAGSDDDDARGFRLLDISELASVDPAQQCGGAAMTAGQHACHLRGGAAAPAVLLAACWRCHVLSQCTRAQRRGDGEQSPAQPAGIHPA